MCVSALAVAFALAARPVIAGELVVVLSSEAAPYAQADTGIRSALGERAASVRTLILKDVSAKGVEASIGKRADAVIAVGTAAATWLHKELPPKTPMLYCMVANAEEAGLMKGSAATGVTTNVPLERQCELIAQALPKARVVGVFYRSNTAEGQAQLKSMQEALPKDWRMEAVAVDKYASMAGAIDSLAERRVDVFWTSADAGIFDTASVRALLLVSLRKKIPVFGFSPAFVRAGALLGIGIDPAAQGRQVAGLTTQLLKDPAGRSARSVSPAADYEIAVNLVVAEQMGCEIPARLVERAVHVFKANR